MDTLHQGRETWTTYFLKRGPSYRAQRKGPRYIKGLYQHLSREHLQQLDKHPSISQVFVEVGDATGHTSQVRVHPFREGLLLNDFPFICVGEKSPR